MTPSVDHGVADVLAGSPPLHCPGYNITAGNVYTLTKSMYSFFNSTDAEMCFRNKKFEGNFLGSRTASTEADCDYFCKQEDLCVAWAFKGPGRPTKCELFAAGTSWINKMGWVCGVKGSCEG